jgi:hypothetical protein
MIEVLQVRREGLPKAIKTLQQVLERESVNVICYQCCIEQSYNFRNCYDKF